ncbi:hypothetical protein GCM10007891_01180 [Methylophaga thalassica]|uniref:Methyltransferase FkbM domain-containing protein n=1 Tax=Methylophaga thalassica TaxID=40223 RepID=A0ABQ5TPD6_9GAMM|nr:FkbM family methyltransferase [Methylophaga thalassica]GLP98264.1 hypothetical protein GCM10007891_01180 [Methylophaga thalassica]
MLKEFIIGTGLDCFLLEARSRLSLVLSSLKSSPSIGTELNDYLATYLLVRLCDDDKTFIDVGSHIGSVISEVKHHRKSKIIAFEAMPNKAEKLTKKFPDITIFNYAVSDAAGKAKFYVNEKLSGYSSLNKSNDTVEIDVDVSTIDTLIDDRNVDVIKIDIEGAELGALKGGVKLINKLHPTIMFESAPGEVLGYTKKQMWEFFDSIGYKIFIPNRLAHNAKPLSLDGFLDSHQYPRRTTNYFAVHESRVDEIKQKANRILS